MYSTHPNGPDSGTINPAALNSAGNSRTTKRSEQMSSRPNETTGQAPVGNVPQAIPPPQTPQNPNAPLPQGVSYAAPPQTSPPPKTTPTKPTTLKALPTVRDHTTDQLNQAGDEYIPREVDEYGEKKVQANGTLTGGRVYRCRTFLVPKRGDKLFMLATECARVLGYRDSYLLFNKNRSLFKIIANQNEKDDLVHQEILPFSYRSRQIAIVTARSMFRQFGSRVIENGRRVRDDYWETKARKQGFTEADPAGEKRPGHSKAREAAEAQNQIMMGGPHGEIVYNNNPGQFPGASQQPPLLQPGMLGAPTAGSTKMPMITIGSDLNDNRARGDYSSVNFKGGPRQEITGPPYHDQTRPAPPGEVNAQAHHAAEYNKAFNQQRDMRQGYLQDVWSRPHEQPQTTNVSSSVVTSEAPISTSRAADQSPHASASRMPQPGLVPNQSPQMMMSNPPYSQSIHSQNPLSHAPMRGSGSASSMPQGAQGYQYPGSSSQMWSHTPQATQHNYSGYTTQSQQSHPQQSPAPQLRHSSSGVQPGMQFSGMPGMSQGYGSNQGMYSTDQTPRQYMAQPNTGNPAVSQGWSGQQSPASQNWWTSHPQ